LKGKNFQNLKVRPFLSEKFFTKFSFFLKVKKFSKPKSEKVIRRLSENKK